MNALELLANQRRGKCLIELNSKLAEVVKACRETGKKGSVTLTLKIRPRAEEMWVDDDVVPKAPEKDKNPSLYYDDLEGRLLQDDPNQKELFPVVPSEEQTAS